MIKGTVKTELRQTYIYLFANPRKRQQLDPKKIYLEVMIELEQRLKLFSVWMFFLFWYYFTKNPSWCCCCSSLSVSCSIDYHFLATGDLRIWNSCSRSAKVSRWVRSQIYLNRNNFCFGHSDGNSYGDSKRQGYDQKTISRMCFDK